MNLLGDVNIMDYVMDCMVVYLRYDSLLLRITLKIYYYFVFRHMYA